MIAGDNAVRRAAPARPGAVPLGGMAIGYAMGLVGWVWDDLEHLGAFYLGFGQAPPHLLMGLGALVVLPALVIALRRFVGRQAAYIYFLLGIASSFVHPLAAAAAFLWLALAAAWFHRFSWFALAAVAMAVVQMGGAVDWAWHRAYPGVSETNMLFLPGHAIQLIGWVVGLLGVSLTLVEHPAAPSPLEEGPARLEETP